MKSRYDKVVQTLSAAIGSGGSPVTCKGCGRKLFESEHQLFKAGKVLEPSCVVCRTSLSKAKQVRDEKHLKAFQRFAENVWPEDSVCFLC